MKTISYKFVEFIPDKLENGIIYISPSYSTVVHKCCCGCGNEVVTPLSPTDWQLIFDGESISLYPSIGNWNYPCRSHYWITNNNVEWARRWTEKQIKNARKKEVYEKENYFNKKIRSSFYCSLFRKKKK